MPKLVNLTSVRCHPPAVNFTPHTSWAAPQKCHNFRLESFISLLQVPIGKGFLLPYYLQPAWLSCPLDAPQFGFQIEVGLSFQIEAELIQG